MCMSQSITSTSSGSLVKSETWQSLEALCQQIKYTSPHIADYFKNDPERVAHFSLSAAGLFLDYSKNQLTKDVLALLLKLAEQVDMKQQIADMFDGEIINNTEQRAVLHVALRSPKQETAHEKEVHATLNKMEVFVHQVQSGNWKG